VAYIYIVYTAGGCWVPERRDLRNCAEISDTAERIRRVKLYQLAMLFTVLTTAGPPFRKLKKRETKETLVKGTEEV
jgi:hypothetical protein